MSDTTLDAWLYGTLVAHLSTDTDGRPRLEFTREAFDRWGENATVVSGLLPLSPNAPHPARVRAWLQGLQPEGRTRTELARRAGVDSDDLVAFFGVFGQETAGALVLVPHGTPPDAGGETVPVTDERIGELLDEAQSRGAADQLNSLGGLEAKIVLTKVATGWAQPTGRVPSTHIVKLARPASSLSADLVDTEVAALALARACSLSTVDAHLETFAGRRAIVVERYDRRSRPDGTVERIHQEDGAQLLGLDTRDPERKFQWGSKLPSLRAIATRLTAMGDPRPTRLLALTVFNLAIGNTDAHAKNISVVHHADGSSSLAPAYDVAMHLHHQHATSRFAMDVNGVDDMTALSAADLVAEARTWGLSARDALTTVHSTLTTLTDALGAIDRTVYPGVSTRAWQTVHERTAHLLEGAPAAPVTRRRTSAARAQDRAPRGTPDGGRFLPRSET